MFRLAPLPRYRLYSSLSSYFEVIKSSVLFEANTEFDSELHRISDSLKNFLGVGGAVLTNQARIGLHVAIKAVVGPTRNKVIMSPYTIFDVVNMVISAGGEPVFCDIRRSDLNLDLEQARSLITDETAAILVTHLHGAVCDPGPLTELCKERNIAIVEDSAQAFGAKVEGRFAGTLGDIGVFSFGLMKNINSYYGGAVVSNNAQLMQSISNEIRDWPQLDKILLARRIAQGAVLNIATFPVIFQLVTYWMFRYGYLKSVHSINQLSKSENNPVLKPTLPDSYKYNIRVTQARLVEKQLQQSLLHNELRMRSAQIYFDVLGDVAEIELPENRNDGSNIFLQFPIIVPDRDELLRYLFKNFRDCAGQHIRNCADLDCFSPWAANCPNARDCANKVVLLPTYPKYTRRAAQKTAEAVKRFYNGHR